MEDYMEAAKTRLEDWERMDGCQRKVCAVHLGGIYIECLLKGIICSEYPTLQELSRNRWKAANGVDIIETERPGHDLTSDDYGEWLEDLYDDMPPEVERNLAAVSRPEGKSYIDYRYCPERVLAPDRYEEWKDSFISVFDYISGKMAEM